MYVDDMLIIGHDCRKIDWLNRKLWLSYKSYIEKVLKRFNMSKAKTICSPLASHLKLNLKQCPTSEKDMKEMSKLPYASVVGSLMYAMVCIRPGITHAVVVVNWFLTNHGKKHWEAVKWILRYLIGTSRVCLCFGNDEPMLDGYIDSYMVGDVDSTKSISGFLMTFAGGSCLLAIQAT